MKPGRSTYFYFAWALMIEASIQIHHGGSAWMLLDQAGELLMDAGTLPKEMCS